MKNSSLPATLIAAIFLLGPSIADACPMCQGGSTETSVFAYRATTVLLVLMPFAIGGFIYRWIKRSMSSAN